MAKYIDDLISMSLRGFIINFLGSHSYARIVVRYGENLEKQYEPFGEIQINNEHFRASKIALTWIGDASAKPENLADFLDYKVTLVHAADMGKLKFFIVNTKDLEN